MTQPCITVVSFGNFEKQILEKVADCVKQEFGFCVVFREMHTELNDFFDPARRQYNGNRILQMVDTLASPDSVKTIGLFNVDLFIPILTYIFGQAYLNGKSGIVSQYRLSNELYGLPADSKLLLSRLIKEVIHELGHCFGLIHCHDTGCVMRSSTYAEDIDQKGERLCSECKGKL